MLTEYRELIAPPGSKIHFDMWKKLANSSEPHEPDYWLLQLLPDNTNFLDVGANIGNSALSAIKVNKTLKITSFEANFALREYLEETKKFIEDSGGDFHYYLYGLGPEKKTMDLFVPKVDNWFVIGESSLIHEHFNHPIVSSRLSNYSSHGKWSLESGQVSIEKFDDIYESIFLGENSKFFVKIDVEGFEESVIQGMHNFIKSNNPGFLIEINEERKPCNALLELGYEPYFYDLADRCLRYGFNPDSLNAIYLNQFAIEALQLLHNIQYPSLAIDHCPYQNPNRSRYSHSALMSGYYGFGNIGDELFLDIIRNQFQSIAIEPTFQFANQPYLSHKLNERVNLASFSIIGGGDLINYSMLPNTFFPIELFEKPVFLYNLGFPSWIKARNKIIEKYEIILAHPSVKYISCRDEESAMELERLVKNRVGVKVFPDMVFSLSSTKFFTPQKEKRCAVIVRIMRDEIDADLIKCLSVLREIMPVDIFLFSVGYILNQEFLYAQKFKPFVDRIVYFHSVYDAVNTLSRYEYCVTSKFHGAVCALNAGSKVLTYASTDKFYNLARMLGQDKLTFSLKNYFDLTNLDRFVSMTKKEINNLKHKTQSGLNDLKHAIELETDIEL